MYQPPPILLHAVDSQQDLSNNQARVKGRYFEDLSNNQAQVKGRDIEDPDRNQNDSRSRDSESMKQNDGDKESDRRSIGRNYSTPRNKISRNYRG